MTAEEMSTLNRLSIDRCARRRLSNCLGSRSHGGDRSRVVAL